MIVFKSDKRGFIDDVARHDIEELILDRMRSKGKGAAASGRCGRARVLH